MTKEEALIIIKERGLKPIDEGYSFHASQESYEIDDLLVILIWVIGSDIPEIEILNIKEQFEEDYKFYQKGMNFMKKLPDIIFKKELKKRIDTNSIKNVSKNIPSMNHNLLKNKIEKFLKTTSSKELRSAFEELGYKFEKIKK